MVSRLVLLTCVGLASATAKAGNTDATRAYQIEVQALFDNSLTEVSDQVRLAASLYLEKRSPETSSEKIKYFAINATDTTYLSLTPGHYRVDMQCHQPRASGTAVFEVTENVAEPIEVQVTMRPIKPKSFTIRFVDEGGEAVPSLRVTCRLSATSRDTRYVDQESTNVARLITDEGGQVIFKVLNASDGQIKVNIDSHSWEPVAGHPHIPIDGDQQEHSILVEKVKYDPISFRVITSTGTVSLQDFLADERFVHLTGTVLQQEQDKENKKRIRLDEWVLPLTEIDAGTYRLIEVRWVDDRGEVHRLLPIVGKFEKTPVDISTKNITLFSPEHVKPRVLDLTINRPEAFRNTKIEVYTIRDGVEAAVVDIDEVKDVQTQVELMPGEYDIIVRANGLLPQQLRVDFTDLERMEARLIVNLQMPKLIRIQVLGHDNEVFGRLDGTLVLPNGRQLPLVGVNANSGYIALDPQLIGDAETAILVAGNETLSASKIIKLSDIGTNDYLVELSIPKTSECNVMIPQLPELKGAFHLALIDRATGIPACYTRLKNGNQHGLALPHGQFDAYIAHSRENKVWSLGEVEITKQPTNLRFEKLLEVESTWRDLLDRKIANVLEPDKALKQ